MPIRPRMRHTDEGGNMEFVVTWVIELDAESAEEAARKALEVQRDAESVATHFRVRDAEGNEIEIDLWR